MRLKTRIIIAIIITIIAGGAGFMIYREGTLPVAPNKEETKIFVINKGDSLNEIINKLAKEDLIRNKLVFNLVVRQLGIEKNIQAGVFRLSPSMNAYDIAEELTEGSLDVSITFIEGQRKEEYAQLISSELGIPETEFIVLANEGYLFPDTYFIPKDETAAGVVKILENNFTLKLEKARAEITQNNDLSEHEIITLASLIEREAKFDQDRLEVANILLRRLREGMALQVDATLQYILGYDAETKTWWRNALSNSHKQIDSPYNTYLYPDLPPGPIANPGLASIKAALSADGDTPYLFYINDPTGKLHVGRTLEEHSRNIENHL